MSVGSKSLDYRRLFFDTPDNMTRLFVHSAKLGVKAVQLIGYQPLVAALRKAEETAVISSLRSRFPEETLLQTLVLFHLLSRSLFRCMLSFVMGFMLCEWIDMIKDTGAKPAASTHSLGTITLLDNKGFEAYLAPVNPIGYGMEPDIESTLKALEQTKKAVIAIKPLAAVKTLSRKVGV